MSKSLKVRLAIGSVALVLGLILGALLADAGPSIFRSSLKYVLSGGLTVSDGAVDFSAADSITLGSVALTSGAPDFSGDITLQNDEFIDNGTNGAIVFGRNDAGVVTLSCADDDATAGCTYDAGGASPIVIGSADVTALTVTTDSTGNAEVVLPSASIGGAELMGATMRVTYCGQNAENGEIFFGPQVLTGVEPALADATCDGFDNATEATADVVLSAGLTLIPKYMRCITNGTLGASETLSFQLRDDTDNVSGVTCSLAEAETTCEVLVPTAAAVAAGSATAVEANEASNNADDDSKCIVLYQVQ